MTAFIDENLKKYIVPSEMRNNSKAGNKIFTSGTRIPLPKDAVFIRLFTAWAAKDGKEAPIDLDLSGAFIKDTKKGMSMHPISFYNQTESFAVHSGDFTHCKAYNENSKTMTAEFIDIDIAAAKNKGFKYILSSNIIYRGAKNFNKVKAISGVQLLTALRTSEERFVNINDAVFSVELTGDFQIHTAVAIDLETLEIVIIDRYAKSKEGSTVGSSVNIMNTYKKLYFNASDFSMNMKDLLTLYCKANEIEIVSDIKTADYVCSYNDYQDLAENQTMFNPANDLSKVLALLS